jgi:hypothetical protein
MRAVSLFTLLLTTPAFAEELSLTDEAGRLSVLVTPWASSTTRSIVQWRGLPVEPSAGVAIFEREGGSRQTRLVVVGSGAPFMLRSSPTRALVKGSTVATWELLTSDRQPALLLSVPGEVQRGALERAYREAHGLASTPMPRERVTAALEVARKKVALACGGSLTVTVDWSRFSDPSLPVVATEVLAALEALCSDVDYRQAIAALRGITVTASSSHDFELERTSTGLQIRVRDDVANPRARASQVLKDTL